MSETLTMNTKERQRLPILGHLKHGLTTVVEAAAALGISERQMYRVLDRYRSQGDRGLIHRLRGQTSNRGYPPEVRTQALRLHRELYPDYGPTLYGEMLLQHHELSIDADTLRRWLKAAGPWLGIRAARRHRQKRERRDAIGAVLQFDGSIHQMGIAGAVVLVMPCAVAFHEASHTHPGPAVKLLAESLDVRRRECGGNPVSAGHGRELHQEVPYREETETDRACVAGSSL